MYEQTGLKLTEHRYLSAFARIKGMHHHAQLYVLIGGWRNVGLLKFYILFYNILYRIVYMKCWGI